MPPQDTNGKGHVKAYIGATVKAHACSIDSIERNKKAGEGRKQAATEVYLDVDTVELIKTRP